MSNENAEGKGDQIVGKVKEAAGKATGDEDIEAKGRAQHAKGKVKEGVGNVKDAVKDFADDDK